MVQNIKSEPHDETVFFEPEPQPYVTTVPVPTLETPIPHKMMHPKKRPWNCENESPSEIEPGEIQQPKRQADDRSLVKPLMYPLQPEKITQETPFCLMRTSTPQVSPMDPISDPELSPELPEPTPQYQPPAQPNSPANLQILRPSKQITVPRDYTDYFRQVPTPAPSERLKAAEEFKKFIALVLGAKVSTFFTRLLNGNNQDRKKLITCLHHVIGREKCIQLARIFVEPDPKPQQQVPQYQPQVPQPITQAQAPRPQLQVLQPKNQLQASQLQVPEQQLQPQPKPQFQVPRPKVQIRHPQVQSQVPQYQVPTPQLHVPQPKPPVPQSKPPVPQFKPQLQPKPQPTVLQPQRPPTVESFSTFVKQIPASEINPTLMQTLASINSSLPQQILDNPENAAFWEYWKSTQQKLMKSRPTSYICPLCSQKFPSQQKIELSQHLEMHFKKNEINVTKLTQMLLSIQ